MPAGALPVAIEKARRARRLGLAIAVGPDALIIGGLAPGTAEGFSQRSVLADHVRGFSDSVWAAAAGAGRASAASWPAGFCDPRAHTPVARPRSRALRSDASCGCRPRCGRRPARCLQGGMLRFQPPRLGGHDRDPTSGPACRATEALTLAGQRLRIQKQDLSIGSNSRPRARRFDFVGATVIVVSRAEQRPLC